MRLRRRTAARILAECLEAGRKPNAVEREYLLNLDPQDVKAGKPKPRTLADTGAAYLQSRQQVGLTWSATGKELAEAREAQGVTVKKPGKGSTTFTAADIPVATAMSKGEYLAACKAFVKKFGVKVAEARKQVGTTPAAATFTLDPAALTPEQVKAIQAILDPS